MLRPERLVSFLIALDPALGPSRFIDLLFQRSYGIRHPGFGTDVIFDHLGRFPHLQSDGLAGIVRNHCAVTVFCRQEIRLAKCIQQSLDCLRRDVSRMMAGHEHIGLSYEVHHT
jgi:hypothetical protein